jgi:methionyl-tRNA formyltransferase
VRLVFAGTPAVAVPSLDALIASPRHEVLAVVTRPDAPVGRHRELSPSPIKVRALEAGIEVLTPRRPSEPEFIQRLTEIDPECCPVVAYGALIPAAALAIPVIGWINLHFSILPAWRGAAPVQRALMAGDDMIGASTFLIETGLDTGPVFGVMTTVVGDRDTAGALLDRLAVDGAALLTATLDGIEDGTVAPVEQPAEGISLAPKLTSADARVDWNRSAIVLDRLVRGCTPAPGAWTTLRGRRVGIGPVLPLAEDLGLPAGTLASSGEHGIVVGTHTGPVALSEVQPEGKPVRAAADWFRGLRLTADERFE